MKLEYIKCNICGKDDYSFLLSGRDYRYNYKKEFNVVKCNQCGLIYLNPRPTFESIIKLYERDYTPEDIINSSLITKTANWKIIIKGILYRLYGYIGKLPKNAKILEVGCGEGNILEILLKRGCEIWGVEPNPKASEICKKKGLNVLCSSLEEANFGNGSFEVVIMSQVLEHLPSPKRSLKEVNRIVKHGGKVYIYCPNAESYLSKFFGKYWHGWHIPFHFYNFTQKTIFKLTNDVGFNIKKIGTATPPHFFTISLKSFLRSENENILANKIGKILDTFPVRISLLPIFKILDFVLKGKGDCLRIELVKRK